MALRRPPTRIELKVEDVEEYEQIRSERLKAAEELASRSASGKLIAKEDLPATSASKMMGRKRSAAERIGLRKDK